MNHLYHIAATQLRSNALGSETGMKFQTFKGLHRLKQAYYLTSDNAGSNRLK